MQGHSATWTRAAAVSRTDQYRLVLRLVLIVEGIAGLALLLAPEFGADLLVLPHAPAPLWPRLLGVLLLSSAAFAYGGSAHPFDRQWPNITLIVSRIGMFVVAVASDGAPVLAVWAAVVTGALAIAYRRAWRADLMSKP